MKKLFDLWNFDFEGGIDGSLKITILFYHEQHTDNKDVYNNNCLFIDGKWEAVKYTNIKGKSEKNIFS